MYGSSVPENFGDAPERVQPRRIVRRRGKKLEPRVR